jgi:glycosyltransferase involved in cell wall biosynthesis
MALIELGPVKLALSTLCENPRRRTGLSTLFPEFIAQARCIFPSITWVVFIGREAHWPYSDAGVELCRDFSSNEHPIRRLLSDHLRLASEARRRGAAALLTVGFFPVRSAGLPIVMQIFALGRVQKGDWIRTAYRRWALNRGLKRAALTITNSEWARSLLGKSKATVIVSPEGLRHDLFRPEGPSGVPSLHGKYLLWASNLYSYKRIELALAAYAGMPSATRFEFPFVIVGGSWGRGRESAEAAAARLGICENVKFLGWVDDEILPALYRGAIAHVLSTSQETFGRSVLESMACGCPNVIQDLPVLREVAGECAVYVDFENTSKASSALERICSDEIHWACMSAAGIERCKQFSFERLARERVNAILTAIGAAQ